MSVKDPHKDFASDAAAPRVGIVREFLTFLRENKRWWLTPIVAVLLALGAIVMMSASPAAPFIYTIF